jgi:hypothetical protein
MTRERPDMPNSPHRAGCYDDGGPCSYYPVDYYTSPDVGARARRHKTGAPAVIVGRLSALALDLPAIPPPRAALRGLLRRHRPCQS